MFPSEPTVHDANVVLTVADPFEMFSKGNRFNPLVMSDTAAELPIIQDKIPPARRLTARLATPARVLGVVHLVVEEGLRQRILHLLPRPPRSTPAVFNLRARGLAELHLRPVPHRR